MPSTGIGRRRSAPRLQAEGRPPAVAADDAALIMAALEGPLILSRTRRDTQPLHVLRRRLPALLVDAKRPAATL